MKKLVLAATVALMFAAPASAQLYDSVGDCISDGFYGNEPNMADGSPGGPSEQAPGTKGGNVVPSQSPGPKVTNPDGSVRPGASVGDIHKQFGGGFVPEVCKLVS